MANIIGLPCELLILIYVVCRDIQTVVRLSFSNRKLHNVWLDNHEHVVKTILECIVSAYDDAVELAKTEVWVSLPRK